MIYLQTPRLIIRDYEPEDIDDYFTLFSDKKAMYYLPKIYLRTVEEAKKQLDMVIDEIGREDRQRYFFCIKDKETGAYIGNIGYSVIENTPLGKLINTGYFILPEFWSKGYASEALREVIRFAFEENNVFRIEAGCMTENIGSEKVMIKCGMMKEADFKSCTWHDGQMKDRTSYRILKSEWNK